MSVLITLTIVTLMLSVPTLMGASPVPVTQDTLGMDSPVHVSWYRSLFLKFSNFYHSKKIKLPTLIDH